MDITYACSIVESHFSVETINAKSSVTWGIVRHARCSLIILNSVRAAELEKIHQFCVVLNLPFVSTNVGSKRDVATSASLFAIQENARIA